jgi:hypothetical protein
MDNFPVVHRLTTLIHTLPTLRRERTAGNPRRLRRNNNKYKLLNQTLKNQFKILN